MYFKEPAWEVPSLFSQFVGYQNPTSKKYLETVGEEKAALHPIGTGPYRHIEGRQGDYHRFEAVPNHWRKTPAFKELVIRRIPDPATRMAGMRAGEIDIAPVFGDYLDQAQKAGLRLHDVPNSACYWVILSGQTAPDREDYCPTCPWVGDWNDPKSRENARKVRLAMNLAVNKKAIISALWRGKGGEIAVLLLLLSLPQGLQHGLEDSTLRRRARQEADGRGRPGGRLRGQGEPDGHGLRARRSGCHGSGGARLGEDRHQVEAGARGHQHLRSEEPEPEDEQDALGVRLAAVRRAGARVAAGPPLQGRLQPPLRGSLRRGHRHRRPRSSTPSGGPS